MINFFYLLFLLSIRISWFFDAYSYIHEYLEYLHNVIKRHIKSQLII